MMIKRGFVLLTGLLSISIIMGCQDLPEPKKNVLLICVDDLRPELNAFGASHIKSPNMDALAAQGRPFFNHYVNAPSCGPSRYTLLTGRYGTAGNDALFRRSMKIREHKETVFPSMPEWFHQQGYTTVSVGKVSHHPGGRGGDQWDNDSIPEMPSAWDRHLMPVGQWDHPRGAMHGLAHGNIRKKASDHEVLEALEGPDDIYPDGLIATEGMQQLEMLTADNEPFFLAIGLIKPHLPFGAPKRYLDLYDAVEFPSIPHPLKPEGKTTWHESGEFMKYKRWGKDPRNDAEFALELRRHYAACVSYSDKLIGDILTKLKETGADKNTIVILWGDHGWHLGEHSIWGKHSLFEESLRSPLVIYDPGMPHKGVENRAIVETLDIFPTLCELTEIETPDFVQGTSLLSMLKNPKSPGHPAIAYTSAAKTIRTKDYRFIEHKDGALELYDYNSLERETVNKAPLYPDLVAELRKALYKKID